MSTFLLLLIALVTVTAVTATFIVLARDGYRPVPTDRTRLPARAVEETRRHRSAAQVDADDEAAARDAEATGRGGRGSANVADGQDPAAADAFAHASVRRGGRARAPRRAASAPTTPR